MDVHFSVVKRLEAIDGTVALAVSLFWRSITL